MKKAVKKFCISNFLTAFFMELVLTFSFTCKFHILHPNFVFFEFRS